jgi:hypothetical protein
LVLQPSIFKSKIGYHHNLDRQLKDNLLALSVWSLSATSENFKEDTYFREANLSATVSLSFGITAKGMRKDIMEAEKRF